MLTPAFPAEESETHWVPTQQLLVKNLKRCRPDLTIVVLSFYYPGRSSGYEWEGIPVHSFNGQRNRKVRRPFFWLAVWRKLNRIRKEREVIGILSFWCGECALVGHYFGRRYAIPHFCWICGQDARKSNKLVRWIRPRAEELIAMSDFLVKEFETNHGIRPRYRIPNGIDPGRFPSIEGQGFGAEERDIDILGAGSLSRLKQYDRFVEVVGALRHSLPGIRSLLCGEGEDRSKIESAIKSAGLEETIRLTGELPHEEVLRLMRRARIFLHTSGYEGFGVVCLEALYAGAQVISFNQPMQSPIPRWHIVPDMAAMFHKAMEILSDQNQEYAPVLPYTMEDSARAILELFETGGRTEG